MKTLTNFYKPSNRLFSSIVYSEKHSKKYSSVAVELVKCLCKIEVVSEGEREGGEGGRKTHQ